MGIAVCACVIGCTRDVRANSLVEDVPVVGGISALSRALGIDPVPERARFHIELVRVIYDAAEGKGGSSDALRAQVVAHLDAAERFRAALTAAQRSGDGLSLSLANQKNDRDKLQRFLDVVGLKLTQKNRTVSVVPTDNKEAAERVRLLTVLGFDRDQFVARLNSGDSVRIDVPTETVPLPLPAQIWGAAVLHRPITSESLFSAVTRDRSAALLAYGLAALDDETLQYFAERPALLRRLYEQNAAVFAAFAGSLRIRRNALIVPGGASAASLWEAVLDQPVGNPDRFIRELFSRREGRVAYLYDSVARLDAGRRAFALGTWIEDPGLRVTRFKTFLDAIELFPGWGVPERPFSRPPDDPILLLARIEVDDRGVPVAPSWRAFWSQAFDGLNVPDNPERLLANLEKDGAIDAAWMAEALLNAPTELRAERLDQLAFGQRAFAGIADRALPDALIAVRAFPRYRMLVLTLERLGIKTTDVYVASVRHADRLAALDPQRAFIALSQYQGVLALLTRLARVHRLDVTQEEALVRSLAAVPLTDKGYAGGIARWVRRELVPRLADGTADVDATILQSLAGPPQTDDAKPVLVFWEERDYRLDLVEPERRRIARTLQRVKAEPVRQALDIETIASTLLRSDLNLNEIEEATEALTTLLASVSPATGEKAGRAARDLSKITRPTEAARAREIAGSLQGIVDELLANALRAWAYAIDLGDAGRVISGDVSGRHDFGLAGLDNERRIRQPWAEPEQVIRPSVPWHVAGSLVGLDLALSQTMLRRVSSDALPLPPRLLTADRDVFARTVALQTPTDFADHDTGTVADAIAAGRKRVEQLGTSADALDEIADAIGMDGWRRRALQWNLTNESADVASYFSLTDLLHLGQPRSSATLHRWGVAAVALDGCLCTEFPSPGRWTIMVGRSRGGQISGQVADLNLRILLALKELGLPAALAKGVLAAATQDYIDSVRPLYPDDWLTLVRSAQAIPSDRIADYVAALTVDGTLAPMVRSPRAPQ
jgi:hypothetical protein